MPIYDLSDNITILKGGRDERKQNYHISAVNVMLPHSA